MLLKSFQFQKANAKEALVPDSFSNTLQQEHQPNQYIGELYTITTFYCISLSLIKTEDVSTQMRSCRKGQGKVIISICALHRKCFLSFSNDVRAAKCATV